MVIFLVAYGNFSSCIRFFLPYKRKKRKKDTRKEKNIPRACESWFPFSELKLSKSSREEHTQIPLNLLSRIILKAYPPVSARFKAVLRAIFQKKVFIFIGKQKNALKRLKMRPVKSTQFSRNGAKGANTRKVLKETFNKIVLKLCKIRNILL